MTTRHGLTVSLVLLLPIPSSPSSAVATATATHSAPAAPFLREAARAGFLPTLLQRDARGQWSAVKANAPAGSPCQLIRGDTLVANRQTDRNPVTECELSLFDSGTRLRAGWTIQRLHWSGDLTMVAWVHDPRKTDRPRITVRLRAPDDTSAQVSASVTLLIVVLLGPPNQAWGSALGN